MKESEEPRDGDRNREFKLLSEQMHSVYGIEADNSLPAVRGLADPGLSAADSALESSKHLTFK